MRPLTGKELARILVRHGWQLVRVRGSHHVFTKPGRAERLSVPVHGNSLLKPGMQRRLIKVSGLPDDAVREEPAVYATHEAEVNKRGSDNE